MEGAVPVEVFGQVLDSIYAAKTSGKAGRNNSTHLTSPFLPLLPHTARNTSYSAWVHAVMPKPRSR